MFCHKNLRLTLFLSVPGGEGLIVPATSGIGFRNKALKTVTLKSRLLNNLYSRITKMCKCVMLCYSNASVSVSMLPVDTSDNCWCSAGPSLRKYQD